MKILSRFFAARKNSCHAGAFLIGLCGEEIPAREEDRYVETPFEWGLPLNSHYTDLLEQLGDWRVERVIDIGLPSTA
jgi:hypothetical protein